MKPVGSTFTRREFLFSFAATLSGGLASAQQPATEPVIDIHQHTHYHDRTDQQLLAHQRAMGVTTTILLPSGRQVQRASTHDGKSNGLAARTGGNETVLEFARRHPGEFLFFAN